jgi:hypothetical protein
MYKELEVWFLALRSACKNMYQVHRVYCRRAIIISHSVSLFEACKQQGNP